MRHAGPNSTILTAALALLAVGCSPGSPPGARATTARGPAPRLTAAPVPSPSFPEASDAGPNIRVNQDASGQDQNETMIDVNPLDPLNLVAVARDLRQGSVKLGYYTSFDGGASWQDGVLTEATYSFQSDPVVAFCGDGSAVAVTLSFNSGAGRGLFAYRSTDGGITWSGTTPIEDLPTDTSLDKEWVACDTTGSAFSNRIYVAYKRSAPGNLRLRFSDDFGATWSTRTAIADPSLDTRNGVVVSVGPSGEVYAVWYDFATDRQMFSRSTDGGASFGNDVVVADVGEVPFLDHLPDTPNSLPSMDVDRGTGPHSGNVYVAWTDYGAGDMDVLFARSTDGGTSWSAPQRVNDDAPGSGADSWFPFIDVDPNGRVVVTFYDTRRDPGGNDYEVWGALSRDGGRTFDTDFLISEIASDGGLEEFFGDYSAVVATSDRLFPVWTDLRPGTGESDLYTERFPNQFAYDEVRNLRFLDATSIDFDPQDARFGQDLRYDTVSGLLSELRADGGYDLAVCLVNDLEDPPLMDTRVPPPGDGYYHLIRTEGPDGVGSYGDGTPARPNVRDALDESLGTCP
jgi:hypothetical protein